jgi:outer membrane lipoprotein carrier protein
MRAGGIFIFISLLGWSEPAFCFDSEPIPAASPSPRPSASPAPRKPHAHESTEKSAALPALLQEVERRYSRAATLKAEFSQMNESASLGTKKNSSGEIMFKRPNKMRWETTSPDKSLLVSDGHKFWYYTPPFDESEHGQVIEKSSSQVESRLAHALLAGSFSASAHDMKIEQKSDSEFILHPKKGTAGTVLKATIEIDPELKLIKKVDLVHRDGNRSEVTLKNIQLGPSIADSEFVFKAPANTDHLHP